MMFFTTYGGYSNYEDESNIYDFIVSQTPQYNNWKDIRSKKTKQFFIQKYVDELAENHQLDPTQKRVLVDTLHTAFLLKTIDSSDIEFEDKKITNIRGLSWNSEAKEFEIPRANRFNKNTKNTRKTVEKMQKNTFASHWGKFVNNILKNKSGGEEISTDLSTTQEDMTDTITDTTFSMSVVSEI
jgi:hypothetical protein